MQLSAIGSTEWLFKAESNARHSFMPGQPGTMKVWGSQNGEDTELHDPHVATHCDAEGSRQQHLFPCAWKLPYTQCVDLTFPHAMDCDHHSNTTLSAAPTVSVC